MRLRMWLTLLFAAAAAAATTRDATAIAAAAVAGCMDRTASQTARAGVALSIRWQEMLNVYLSTLINNIVPLGFSADQYGLMAYNHHFTGLMASKSPLTEDLKALHKNVRGMGCGCHCQAFSPRMLLLGGSRVCFVCTSTDLADFAAQVV